eukprot:CCRYP_015569-RA/>CCRYP_015569-RA protein AED:0.29 eAED:0.29 QI:0/-1/0/1/-1/1/1/0/978
MEESHSGFMAPLLYHARKVLFPDALSADVATTPHFRGIDNAPVAKQTQDATAFKRNEKSRRGRTNAATCSLAAVSTDVTMKNHGTKHSADYYEKENRIPIPRSNNIRGGAFRKKMDSLASTTALEGTQRHGRSGGFRRRRDDWSSLGSVPSSSSLAKSVHNDCEVKVPGVGKTTKPLEQLDSKWNSLSSQQSSSNENISSGSHQNLPDNRDTNNSVSSIHESKKERRRRRRGRCQHPVSSLVQNCDNESNKMDNGKRATVVSSLMNLPSSIQKQHQRPHSVSDAAALRRNQNRQSSTKGQEDDLIHNIQSMKIIDDALKSPSKIQSFQPQQSLPSPSFHSPIVYKQRPFATAGECTSPPSALHRVASVTNHIFQKAVTSCTPASKASHDYTPGSSARPVRKRMDKKKTPDKLIGLEECGSVDVMSPMAASPLVTEFSVTPKSLVRRQRRIEKSNDLTEKDNALEGANDVQDCAVSLDCVEDHDETSHDGVSPRDLLISRLNECEVPELGVAGFGCAKANLFPDRFDASAVDCNVPSNTAANETKVMRGSSVIAVEMATPRVNRPKLAMEDSRPDENRTKVSIRGSAVLSVQKAPPLWKPEMPSQVERGGSADKVIKKTKAKHKKSGSKKLSVPTSRTTAKPELHETQQSKFDEAILAGEGKRRSARESKPTDRFTVDTWNDNDHEVGARKVRFTNNDADDLSPEKLNGANNCNPTSPLIKKNECVIKHEMCAENQDPSALSSEQDMTTTHSRSCSSSDGQWSSEEVSMLRKAQNNIDPTISSYWEEVACLLGGKSASECREKWFSLVATPKGRPQKDAMKDQLPRGSSNSKIVNNTSFDEEDDLFQSTPWRGALLDLQNDTLAKKLSQTSTFGTSFGLSPCIQSAAVTNSFLQHQDTSALKDRRKGYKTYIDNLRKDLNPSNKNAKKGAIHKHVDSQRSVPLENGVWGVLRVDGSVQISMQEESEEEMDDFFDEEVED